MDSKPLHLVIRFSDSMFDVGDVVARHNELVKKHGAVWFGKLGTAISLGRMRTLNEQISNRIPTHVYLVKGHRQSSTPFKARLLAIAPQFPKKERALVPEYYSEKGMIQFMKAWAKIGRIVRVDMSSLQTLQAIGSITPLAETLARSPQGYFLVHESNRIF